MITLRRRIIGEYREKQAHDEFKDRFPPIINTWISWKRRRGQRLENVRYSDKLQGLLSSIGGKPSQFV